MLKAISSIYLDKVILLNKLCMLNKTDSGLSRPDLVNMFEHFKMKYCVKSYHCINFFFKSFCK